MTPDEMVAARRKAKDAEYRRRRNYLVYKGIPTSLVPADEAAQHVLRMYRLGWSYNSLEDTIEAAVSSETIRNLADGKYPTISRSTHNAVLAIPYTLAPAPTVRDEAFIPGEGAARRVRALMRMGWTHGDLNERGLVTRSLVPLTYQQMLARKWRRVAAVYAELSMQPGPSRFTASRAATRGYVPPLGWDDVDDPDEQPSDWEYRERKRVNGTTADLEPVDQNVIERILAGEWRLPASPLERIEVARQWAADGGSVNELARRTGWKVDRYLKLGEVA